MTISTPSMGLQKPEVTVTPGPQWATDLNASLDLLDTHDHSNGKGVKITPAGININTNIPFNTNFATNAGGYQFAMVAAPTIDDVLYVDTTGNLRYKNAMGDFRILNPMGEIAGGFTGDYTSTDAEANYNNGLKTYRFWQDAGITANVDVGAVNIYENILSANAVTLQSPTALASAYSLTLPTALAGFNNLPIISNTAGVLSYNDQSVTTTSQPTFVTVNTGQGNNELYAMDQAVRTTDAVTFTTVDTGQGANELYAMNQNVRTSDSVTFVDVSATLNSVDYSALTQAEINQIANINAITISNTQWGYLGALDQSLATTDSPTFVTATLQNIDATTILDYDTTQYHQFRTDNVTRFTADDTSLSPNSDLGYRLGGPSLRYNQVYTNEITTDNVDAPSSTMNFRLANTIYMQLLTTSLNAGGLDLGTSGNRWDTAFLTDLDVAAGASLGGSFENGTYTPTLTTNAGSAGAVFLHLYSRVGDIVTVSGTLEVTTDVSGDIDVEITLPISSNFSTSEDAMGGISLRRVVSPSTTLDLYGTLFAQASNNRIQIVVYSGSGSDATQIRFTAQYIIR